MSEMIERLQCRQICTNENVQASGSVGTCVFVSLVFHHTTLLSIATGHEQGGTITIDPEEGFHPCPWTRMCEVHWLGTALTWVLS